MDKRYASSGPGEKYSITGISRIPEAGSSLRRKENSRHPCSSFITERRSVGSSIAFTAKFPTCLITSQISLRRYHFLDIFSPFFFSSLSIFFFILRLPVFRRSFSLSLSLFSFFPSSTLVSFAIGEDSECQQCSTKVDARCVCYWIPSRTPFSRRAAVSRNKLIEILLSL